MDSILDGGERGAGRRALGMAETAKGEKGI